MEGLDFGNTNVEVSGSNQLSKSQNQFSGFPMTSDHSSRKKENKQERIWVRRKPRIKESGDPDRLIPADPLEQSLVAAQRSYETWYILVQLRFCLKHVSDISAGGSPSTWGHQRTLHCAASSLYVGFSLLLPTGLRDVSIMFTWSVIFPSFWGISEILYSWVLFFWDIGK